MNQAKLIKMAPTLLMISFLGYLGYSVQSSADELTGSQGAEGSTLAQVEKEIVALESAVMSSASAVRDPFRTVAAVAQEIEAEATQGGADHTGSTNHSDAIAEMLKAMTLEATFVQGNAQLAIIDGKFYRKGQRLTLPESKDTGPVSLEMTFVGKDRVFFRGASKTYSLGYPERLGGPKAPKPGDNESPLEAEMAEIDPAGELEFLKSLSNTPLGRMGKGLTKSMGIELPASADAGSQ